MKNIIGFVDDIKLVICKDCGCVFTVDSEDDVNSWTINNKKENFTNCPNCKSICKRLFEVRTRRIGQ